MYNRTKGLKRMPLTPQDFVSKWERIISREKQTYQNTSLMYII